MAQFDSLIIFSLLSSLLFVLFIHYTMSIKDLIPNFFGTKKFREKKLSLSSFFWFLKKHGEVKSNSSYTSAF